jgi:F0F1-type ATP synthase assembly protein I
VRGEDGTRNGKDERVSVPSPFSEAFSVTRNTGKTTLGPRGDAAAEFVTPFLLGCFIAGTFFFEMPSDPRPDYRPEQGKAGGGGASVGTMFGLGFQFAAVILLAVLAGQWADRRFGSDPWGVLIGAFLGFGAGFFSIYRTVTAQDRKQGSPKSEQGPR